VTQESDNKPSPFQMYKAPEWPTIAAAVSVAAVLFFTGYTFMLHTEIQRVQTELSDLKTELLRSQMQQPSVMGSNPQLGYAPGTSRYDRIENGIRHDIEIAQAIPQPDDASVPLADVKPEMTRVSGVGEITSISAMVAPAAGSSSTAQTPIDAATADAGRTALSGGAARPASAVEEQAAPVRQPELGGIVEEPLPQAPSLVQGQVLWTNPDQQRVMISCGANNGLQPGRRFTIWRGTKYLGEVRVSKVFQTMCACDITTPSPLGMRKGDRAQSVDAERSMRGVLLGG